jgi:hypothetical protein
MGGVDPDGRRCQDRGGVISGSSSALSSSSSERSPDNPIATDSIC